MPGTRQSGWRWAGILPCHNGSEKRTNQVHEQNTKYRCISHVHIHGTPHRNVTTERNTCSSIALRHTAISTALRKAPPCGPVVLSPAIPCVLVPVKKYREGSTASRASSSSNAPLLFQRAARRSILRTQFLFATSARKPPRHIDSSVVTKTFVCCRKTHARMRRYSLRRSESSLSNEGAE